MAARCKTTTYPSVTSVIANVPSNTEDSIVVKTAIVAFAIGMDRPNHGHTFVIAQAFVALRSLDLQRFHVKHYLVVIVVLHFSHSCWVDLSSGFIIRNLDSFLLEQALAIANFFGHYFFKFDYAKQTSSQIDEICLYMQYSNEACIRIPYS